MLHTLRLNHTTFLTHKGRATLRVDLTRRARVPEIVRKTSHRRSPRNSSTGFSNTWYNRRQYKTISTDVCSALWPEGVYHATFREHTSLLAILANVSTRALRCASKQTLVDLRCFRQRTVSWNREDHTGPGESRLGSWRALPCSARCVAP